MKTILVPTDFSKSATNALNFAIAFAKKEKAKIILLHAYNIVYVSADVSTQYYAHELLEIENSTEAKLAKVCDAVQKTAKISCSTLNMKGIAEDVIADVIKKKRVDLVIMGTKGASGINEFLIGSITARVIARSTRPVMAIPAKAHFEGIKKIIFATDYHAKDLVALKELAEIAGMFKSKISVVHVADKEYTEEAEVEFLNKFAKKANQKITYKHISFKLLASGEIEKALEKYIKKESAGLLAVSTKNRNFVERLFAKSIAKKLVYHTKVPLLVFHYK